VKRQSRWDDNLPHRVRQRRADAIGYALLAWALLATTLLAFGWLYAYAQSGA
jgi:hypothetical protein